MLGPVTIGGEEVSPMRRAVLCALVLRRDPVGKDELIRSLWGTRPPSSATRNLQTYVAGLRDLLEPGRAGGAEPRLLVTVASGYELRVDDDLVDLRRFDRLVARADELGVGSADGLAAYTAAIRLCAGEPLAGAPGPFAAAQRALLFDRVLAATESWVCSAIIAGVPDLVVDTVLARATAVSERPSLTAHAMVALEAAGRKDEAVALVERRHDQGWPSPTRELRELMARLAGGGRDTAPVPGTGRRVPVPAQLPHALPEFVGRETEFAQMRDAVTASGPAPRVAVLHGVGGAGKTALAVHFGHSVADLFPDGALYVDLRGFSPGPRPLAPSEALAALLRGLGADRDPLPDSVRDLAVAYRTAVAGRRVLVVLDNAVDAEQVRHLLPGTPTAFTVVTSRTTMAELLVRHGAVSVVVGALEERQAVVLLAGMIGRSRVAAEPAAAVGLARVCGRLPLPLRVLAERAAVRTTARLADLLAELTDTDRRLELLSTYDTTEAVGVVLSWSYRSLPDRRAMVFRFAGLFPGQGLVVPAMAAFTGLPLEVVAAELRELAAAHLVEPAGRERYVMHDLMRLSARGREQLSIEEYGAARRRLLDWYVGTALSADLHISGHHKVPVVPIEWTVAPMTFPDHAAAMLWCDAELANHLDLVDFAARAGLHRHACELANALIGHLSARGRTDQWAHVARIAVEQAELVGDHMLVARSRYGLATVQLRRGEYGEVMALCAAIRAVPHPDRGHHRLVLHHLTSSALLGLGLAAEAAHDLTAVLAEPEDQGAWHGMLLANLGEARTRTGDLDGAVAAYTQALAVQDRVGDRRGASTSLASLGQVQLSLGHHATGIDFLGRAREVACSVGGLGEQAVAAAALGEALLRTGEVGYGRERLTEALRLFEQLDDRRADDIRTRLAEVWT